MFVQTVKKLISSKLFFQQLRSVSSSQSIPLEGLQQNELKNNPNSNIKKTVLDSGVEVISVDTLAASSKVGLLVRAGSRYENASLPQGVSHFLAKLAFQSTYNRTAFNRTVTIENETSQFSATAGRENISYVGDLPRENLESFVSGSLSESLIPVLHEYELRDIKPVVRDQVLNSCPGSLVLDALHREAYDDKSLGRSNSVPLSNFDFINEGHLQQHLTETYLPNNLALVGVGVDHDELVSLAQRTIAATSEATSSSSSSSSSEAKYFGGRLRLQTAPQPSLTAIAFDASKVSNPYALGVLTEILGSARVGARLRTCCNGLLYQDKNLSPNSPATAFYNHYSGAGLFGVISETSSTSRVLDAFSSLSKLGQDQVSAAATKASLQFAEKTSSNNGLFEFLSYQVFNGSNQTKSTADVLQNFQKVSLSDVQTAIKQLSVSNPTIASIGSTDNVVQLDQVSSSFK